MDLTLLATLKDKLIHATDFSDVFTYFLDHFGEDEEFIEQGEVVRNEFLEQIYLQVGQQVFGRPVVLTNILFKHLPEHHFYHGGACLDGQVANVLYFEDACAGLLAILWSEKPGETKFARFRGRPLTPPPKPSVN
jgi:hypothetical protein